MIEMKTQFKITKIQRKNMEFRLDGKDDDTPMARKSVSICQRGQDYEEMQEIKRIMPDKKRKVTY